MDNNTCKKIYKDYKQTCEIVYSDIMCAGDISNMTITELNKHAAKILKLRNKSKVCYELRKKYNESCISVEKRDKGHAYAILLALKYYNICKNELEDIKKRINYLQQIMNETQNMLSEIDNDYTSEWTTI